MLRRLTDEHRLPPSVNVREAIRQRHGLRLLGAPGVLQRVSFGRSGSNDVVLSSDAVPCLLSREHAYIFIGPDNRCVLVDKGTPNGTYVRGRGEGVPPPSPAAGLPATSHLPCPPRHSPPAGQRTQASLWRAASSAL